jgi:hypothetical protein
MAKKDPFIKTVLEFVSSPDAAERLAQAYDLLFSKTGRKQLGVAEGITSEEEVEQEGR